MIGTILNVVGILIGGIVGLTRRKPLSPASESYFRVVLAAFTVFYGLRLTLLSLNGTFLEILKQFLIVLISLMLGKMTGRLLRLQKLSNRVGQQARAAITAARPDNPGRAGEGFRTCAALFCAAPLGIIGAIEEGLTSPPYFYPLAIKAVIDGLAALSFVLLFGRGVLLSAIPVLTIQGTLTLLTARFLEPVLTAHQLTDSVSAVGGLLIFCVALIMLELKKLELTDYFPSLIIAPLITWLWR